MEILIMQGFSTATPRIIVEKTVRSLDFQYWSLGNLIVNEIKNFTSLGQLVFMERLNKIEREAHEIKTYLESRIEVTTIDNVGTIEEIASKVVATL